MKQLITLGILFLAGCTCLNPARYFRSPDGSLGVIVHSFEEAGMACPHGYEVVGQTTRHYMSGPVNSYSGLTNIETYNEIAIVCKDARTKENYPSLPVSGYCY